MNKDNNKWYDNANIIINLIICVILLIIISSQSFTTNNSSLKIFSSIINHNSIYLLVLVYFVLIKFKFGKKYFNYLNLFLLIIYLLATITSLLTIFQSFGLNTVIDFILNFIIVIYFSHTMFRDTIYWKEYKLNNSPFNEFNNEWYFNATIILGVFNLCVSLISTSEVSGVVLSLLDFIYIVLLSRYIYLYREYLDINKINSNNKGNFDSIKDKASSVINDIVDGGDK